MKKPILFGLLVILCFKGKAQDSILTNNRCIIRHTIRVLKNARPNSKPSIVGHPGDTIMIMNETNGYVFVDLKGVDGFVTKKYLIDAEGFDIAESTALRNVKRFQNQENDYVKKYGKKYGPLVMSGDIAIGMTKKMVLEISGKPEHINTTNYSFGNTEQWVYKKYDLHQFYYFTNGHLTSWQDSN
jgi:hypothetical protein